MRQRGGRMRTVFVLVFALALQISSRTTEENVRIFRPIDPDSARHQSAARIRTSIRERRADKTISILSSWPQYPDSSQAHGRATPPRLKNNWMGLMTQRGPKRFATPQASIFYAAELLKSPAIQRPFEPCEHCSHLLRHQSNKLEERGAPVESPPDAATILTAKTGNRPIDSAITFRGVGASLAQIAKFGTRPRRRPRPRESRSFSQSD